MWRVTWFLALLLPCVSIGCSPNGDGTDAGGDSGRSESFSARASTPKDSVTFYLRAMAGEVPFEEVAEFLDWKALKKAAAAKRPAVRAVSMERFRKELLSRMKSRVGRITPEQLAEIVPGLQVEEEGDRATVTMPDREGASFTLRRVAAGWVISGLPANG
jgi:hypothetical protein